MCDQWLVTDSGPYDPAFNMALDEALLLVAPETGQPVLRLYQWALPAASFGYFQKYSDVETATLLRPLIRRPTGGGFVPHDADWTYSVTIPAGHEWHGLRADESYRRMHEWVQAAFALMGVETMLATGCRKPRPGECFAGYEVSDVLWQSRKVAGAAQRRTRSGLLIQGSVQLPPMGLSREAWCKSMREAMDAYARPWVPDTSVRWRADDLARTKYALDSYNRRR